VVDAERPLAIRIGAQGDKFNLLLVVYGGDPQKNPLRLYFDFKSHSPHHPSKANKYSDSAYSLKQCDRVRVMNDSAKVPFEFFYWTHNPGSESERGCLILRKNETRKFLGPMWPIFMACRRSTFWKVENMRGKQTTDCWFRKEVGQLSEQIEVLVFFSWRNGEIMLWKKLTLNSNIRWMLSNNCNVTF